jgi:AbrB family looped-hinge helix DNA binding protein
MLFYQYNLINQVIQNGKKKEKRMENKNIPGCTPDEETGKCCCKIESLVTVDERGQMVLPKEIREKAGIKAGDKLAVIGWEQGGKISCLSIVKAEELTEMVKTMLGPMVKDITEG